MAMQTINNYQGDNRSCLVSNCLFRMGGAASIISNVYVCCRAHAAQPAPGTKKHRDNSLLVAGAAMISGVSLEWLAQAQEGRQAQGQV